MIFFHRSLEKDNIPQRPPNLNINGLTVERESSITLLRIRIDENRTWGDYIYKPLKIKLQLLLDSFIKESITSLRIASSKSTLLTYMLI